jgi:hypothetical protein
MFKGLVCLLAVGGGVFVFTGHGIPGTETDFSQFPGGSTVSGGLLMLLGLWLATRGE